MTFHQNLKQRMTDQGLNQTTLAQRAGVTKQSVSQWCLGGNRPSKKALVKLADALSCTVGELTGEEGAPPDPDFELDVSVTVAAQLIGKPEQFVRNALIQGTAPFGFAVKGEGRYSFSISPHKLAEYTGKAVSGT